MAQQTEEWVLRLRDQFSKNIKRADKNSQRFGRTAQRLKGTLTTLMPLASIAGGVLVFRKLIQVASGFEKEMSAVKAISQANKLEFLDLERQADQLGKTTAFTGQQAAEAMGFLSMAGFDVQQTMGALPGTLDLAAAGAIDLGRAADIASNVLTQYGLAASEMNHVNDILVKTTTRANVNIEQLSEGLKYTGTTAKILKQPLEETAAALGVLGNAGLQGSMGGTSLNFAMLEMARQSSPTAKKLKKLGVETHDVNGEFSGLTNILKQFEALGIESTTILDTFGARGGRAMGTLVEAGSEAVEKLTELNRNAQGIAKTVAEMRLDNLAGDTVKLKSASEGLAISLGKRMNPVMRYSVQRATELVSTFESWIKIPLSEELRRERAQLNAQFNVLKRGNVHADVRKRIINEINVEYGDYLPNLLEEKSSLEDIEIAQKAVNKELRERISIEAKKEVLREAEEKAIKARKKLIDQEVAIEATRMRMSEETNKGRLKGHQELLEGQLAHLSKYQKQYNKEIDKVSRLEEQLDLPTAQERAVQAGLDAAGETTVTARPSRDLEQTITSAAPKVFNITINKLIETQEINTTTLKEGSAKIKRQIIETLLEGLNETQTMVGR